MTTTTRIEARLEEIKEELEELQLLARDEGDRALERQINAAWRELNISRAAFR
jgi:hypothetical protein